MYQICHYLKSFEKFLIENKFARDALDGYRCVSVEFRDAYNQALLDDPIIQQESKDEAYEVSHLPPTHSRLHGLPPVHQQGNNFWRKLPSRIYQTQRHQKTGCL
jgi:hypothetical protein